ncbi:hypothetical protein ABZW10_36610 [Kitasatospora sp. NPDC004723]|uniref:hypothetical protein n=1 Tax=Kitasatospora sp. NPDC004723 TaxID=3154288 RepID=UPI0033ADAD18
MTYPEPTDETAVQHVLAAAARDIVDQSLAGHDADAVLGRLGTGYYIVRAHDAYEKARGVGKTPRGAVREAALVVIKRYRFEYRLGEFAR